MSNKTDILKLRYLSENDVANYSNINHALTRIDALSTLAVESVGLANEPVLDASNSGQVYAILAGATGPVWGSITEDSIAIWGPTSDFSLSGQFGTGYRWHIIPVWEGAYAYDKATEAFVTYANGRWAVPSRRSVVCNTYSAEEITALAGTNTSVWNWEPLVRIDAPFTLVEMYCHITYKASIFDSKIDYNDFFWDTDDLPTFGVNVPRLPYILPEVRFARHTEVGGVRDFNNWIPESTFHLEGKWQTGTSPTTLNREDHWAMPGAEGPWGIAGGSFNYPFVDGQIGQTGGTAQAASFKGLVSGWHATGVYPSSTSPATIMLNLSDVRTGSGGSDETDIASITIQAVYTTS